LVRLHGGFVSTWKQIARLMREVGSAKPDFVSTWKQIAGANRPLKSPCALDATIVAEAASFGTPKGCSNGRLAACPAWLCPAFAPRLRRFCFHVETNHPIDRGARPHETGFCFHVETKWRIQTGH
jgi:hypothetical protein